MIIQHNNNRYGYLSRLMVLPVSLLLFFSLALYAGDKKKTVLPVNNQPVTDTIPAGEQRAILELKLKAEQEAISNQKIRLDIKQKAEQEIVQSQRMRLELKRKAEKEELENRQLTLQKILAEKNMQATDKNVNIALERELLELKLREESLQQTQKKVITLRLKQDINRQLEEKQAMERERQLLLLQQQDLESKKDNRKSYQEELKIIAEKKQALDLVVKENMERESLAMIKEEEAKANAMHERRIQLQLQEKITSQQPAMTIDTMQRALIRYLNRNLRYPEAARKNGGKGDVYSSMFMNEDGVFNDIQTYEELPSEANGHFQEIVIVGYAAKIDQPDNTSAADIKKLFMAEAERVFKKKTGIPVNGKIAPKKYFFKISFRLESDK